MTRSHPRRTWPQRLVIGLNLLAILGCLLAVAALVYGYRRVSRIARVELGDVLTSSPALDQADGAGSGPENFLIVGTDSGERLDPEDPAGIGRPGGIRSDSIMILRVDPGTGRAALLSLPRDLWVPIAGTGGSQRINSAVNQGGPELLVRTIQGALSIPVHHYVEVDFRGFYDLVDAIGGVPVYFPEPVRDNLSGLDIPEPGCVALDPEMALAYVRARNYEVYRNGRWRTDPSADLGRITRQQDFVRRALQRAIDRGARNPVVLDNLLDAAVGNLTIDDQLTPGDLVDLASRFRNFSPENLDTYSLPVDDDVVNGAMVLRLREREARPILDRFRGVEAGVLTPASVLVTVQNGTGQPGAAGTVADDLRAVGFTVSGGVSPDADRFDYERTTVLVPDGLEDQAD
ncbi:MAG: LCP family protein, partial [Acidimicrobiales bacterium]